MKSLILPLAMALSLSAVPATAGVLLVDRVQAEADAAVPTRGTTMGDVEARFGAPSRKYAAISGPNSVHHNPPMTRWAYPGYSVYFEYDHVVDVVVNKATPTEVGPMPVQQ